MEPVVKVVDLTGGWEYQSLLKGQPQTHGMRSGKVCLQPGQSCGRHSTKTYEEILIFLSGTGKALIEGNKDMEVGHTKVVYIPPYTEHDVENTGSEPLVYIYCVAPVQVA